MEIKTRGDQDKCSGNCITEHKQCLIEEARKLADAAHRAFHDFWLACDAAECAGLDVRVEDIDYRGSYTRATSLELNVYFPLKEGDDGNQSQD